MSNADHAQSTTTAGFTATLPLPLFASVMGTCGLGLVWHAVETRWDLSPVVSATLTTIAAAVFVILLAAYAVKALHHRDRVMAELRHPVRINFLPAIAINLLLLGILSRPWLESVSNMLWISGAALQLFLTLLIVTVWLNSHRPPNSLNPAWFIPAVGNVLVPVAAIPAGFELTGWFFFSIGLFYWIILGTLVFYRLVIGDALEAPMRPTLAILMAPPSVAFLAWLQLAPGPTNAGLVLYFIALLNFLLLIPQVPGFLRLPFFPSWWAYTFPLAAFTVATFRFDALTGAVGGTILAALAGLVTLVIVLVAARTLLAVGRGELAAH
ncbi:SLAC1 anion channel family protein [Wenzhouxiangella limi]|uniref:C4-dicarboxylate ABC transporter n=1 Tax=Wenzhouxiangella limi TaxID=2707351 RepID=A0A845V355_9GAMM|nr:SLAC1 anion channel family protein [Wenzhouxiangella limi]NDY97072.1 C4-dicarboxylate ABC transporter [Wenzhouxiangella limi]